MMAEITYPYKPAIIGGIIFLIAAFVFVWIGPLGIVLAIVCLAGAIGSIAAAYTTVGCEKMTWEKEKTIIKNFICRIIGCKFVYRMNQGSGASYGATCSRCGEHL